MQEYDEFDTYEYEYPNDPLWGSMYPDEQNDILDFMYKEMGIRNFAKMEFEQKRSLIEAAKKLYAERCKIDPRDIPAMVDAHAIASWAAELPANQNQLALGIKSMINDLFNGTKIDPETQAIIAKLGKKEMPVAPSFQGDFVVNKQVQNEVNSVQGGGIGFNINEI